MYSHSLCDAGVVWCWSVSGGLVAGEAAGRQTLTGKLVVACRCWTHCLTQAWMRLCTERVPRLERRWRLVHNLVEDGLLEAESEEVVSGTESEEQLSETEEEDLSFLNESESEEWETETSQSEWEGEEDWFGLIET